MSTIVCLCLCATVFLCVRSSLSLGTSQDPPGMEASVPPPHYLSMAAALIRQYVGGVRCWVLKCAPVSLPATAWWDLMTGARVGPLGEVGCPRGSVRSGTVGSRQGLQACHCSPVWLLHCDCGGTHVWGSPQHFPGGLSGCLFRWSCLGFSILGSSRCQGPGSPSCLLHALGGRAMAPHTL